MAVTRKSPEYEQQKALFTWAGYSRQTYPALDLLSCSLNGVKLSKAQAGKAKGAGMKKGEHDIKLLVARGGFHGLSIELKAGKNKPTTDQLEYGRRLTEEGYFVAYCWSWEDAKNMIIKYLSWQK